MTIDFDSEHVYTCDTQQEFNDLDDHLDPPPQDYTKTKDEDNLKITLTRDTTYDL